MSLFQIRVIALSQIKIFYTQLVLLLCGNKMERRIDKYVNDFTRGGSWRFGNSNAHCKSAHSCNLEIATRCDWGLHWLHCNCIWAKWRYLGMRYNWANTWRYTQSKNSYIIYNSYNDLVGRPTRRSLLFIFGFLFWSSNFPIQITEKYTGCLKKNVW